MFNLKSEIQMKNFQMEEIQLSLNQTQSKLDKFHTHNIEIPPHLKSFNDEEEKYIQEKTKKKEENFSVKYWLPKEI
jgi:hypothetical protein